jgi:predicted RNA-binding protein associated with RNAse of E/G family
MESGKPWYDDLFLDIVLRAGTAKSYLDEDELAQARGDGLVTAEQFKMAHRACRELMTSG